MRLPIHLASVMPSRRARMPMTRHWSGVNSRWFLSGVMPTMEKGISFQRRRRRRALSVLPMVCLPLSHRLTLAGLTLSWSASHLAFLSFSSSHLVRVSGVISVCSTGAL